MTVHTAPWAGFPSSAAERAPSSRLACPLSADLRLAGASATRSPQFRTRAAWQRTSMNCLGVDFPRPAAIRSDAGPVSLSCSAAVGFLRHARLPAGGRPGQLLVSRRASPAASTRRCPARAGEVRQLPSAARSWTSWSTCGPAPPARAVGSGPLDDENQRSLFVSEGLGHASTALASRPPSSTCAPRVRRTRSTAASARPGRGHRLAGRRGGPVGQRRRRPVAGGGARRRAAPLLPRLPGVWRGPARSQAVGRLPGLTSPARPMRAWPHGGGEGPGDTPDRCLGGGFPPTGVPDERRREDAGRAGAP